MPRYCCAVVPNGVASVRLVVVPAVAAVGAPTEAAVVVSAMVQHLSSLPHSGAVAAVPEPRRGTLMRMRGRKPPTMPGDLSSVPVSSGLSTTTGSYSISQSAAMKSLLAGVPPMASCPGVVSIFTATAANRMRTRLMDMGSLRQGA